MNSISKSGPIILLAEEPGGANLIAQLAESLKRAGYLVLAIGIDSAAQQFSKLGIPVTPLNKVLSEPTLQSCIHYLNVLKPAVVVTGTSGHATGERLFWAACRRTQIPSIACLDSWVNYRLRFTGDPLIMPVLENLPSRICVMDDLAFREMIQEGFPPNLLRITGQPFFQYIIEKGRRTNIPVKTKASIRILFASQPLTSLYGGYQGTLDYWGYNELSILKELSAVLQKLSQQSTLPVQLCLRPHPLENASELAHSAQIHRTNHLTIELDSVEDLHESLVQSSLICGMWSMVLVEAALLGIPVCPIQVGSLKPDPLPLERWGAAKTMRNWDDVERLLGSLVKTGFLPIKPIENHKNAIESTLRVVEEFLCQN